MTINSLGLFELNPIVIKDDETIRKEDNMEYKELKPTFIAIMAVILTIGVLCTVTPEWLEGAGESA